MKEQLRKYIENNLKLELPNLFNRLKTYLSSDEEAIEEEQELYKVETCRQKRTTSISDYIEENKNKYNSFQTLLFKLIDERNLKDSDVYNKVHLDRRLFSKIRSDNTYHPSKETVILLGLSLELSEKDLESLLESAAYSLPKNNHYDLIIRFCFINKIFKLTEVNDLLDEYNCKLFNY